MIVLNNFAKGNGISRLFVYLGILSPNLLLSRIFDEINADEESRMYFLFRLHFFRTFLYNFLFIFIVIGVQWNNLFSVEDPMAPGERCLGVLAIFSIIGTIVNFFMAVYVYTVRPGKYGVAQNPLFCLQVRSN